MSKLPYKRLAIRVVILRRSSGECERAGGRAGGGRDCEVCARAVAVLNVQCPLLGRRGRRGRRVSGQTDEAMLRRVVSARGKAATLPSATAKL